jgi:hypothetical protein
MDHSRLLHALAEILMTLEAEFPNILPQKLLVISGMDIMALCTIPLNCRTMTVFALDHIFIMTGGA